MRKLECPSQTAAASYDLCISRVRNRSLRTRLRSVRPNVTSAAANYVTLAETSLLHTFPRSANVAGAVTKEEMGAVYTARMVGKKGPGRGLYDALIAGATRGRCPLCGVGQVTTLDHHLPKSKFPVLSVTPANLVPACTWCQNAKLEGFPRTAEEQTIHPYFDDFEDEPCFMRTSSRDLRQSSHSLPVLQMTGQTRLLRDFKSIWKFSNWIRCLLQMRQTNS